MSQAWSQHDVLFELNYPIKLKEKRKENIKVKGELNGYMDRDKMLLQVLRLSLS